MPTAPAPVHRDLRLVYDADGQNTACAPAEIAEHFLTPVDQFFTRSHAGVPVVDPKSWRLEIGGLVRHPASFSLAELRAAFPRREVAATLVCAGLRRVEFLSVGPLPGELAWGPEPASTARWSGVALSDVLEAAGVDPRARHVEFAGRDQVERHGHRFGFGGSIDLKKARSGEVILATELNGTPLPPAHGFPLRAVVPGWIGARSVKWLERITATDRPSENYFQTRAYRVQKRVNPQDPRDVSDGVVLTGVPVNAVILDPMPHQMVPAGALKVRGWAMGSEGRALASIELSPNGGKEWMPGRILESDAWTWTFWEAELELTPGQHTLIVRATDSAGATQPPNIRDAWNVKGYNNNAWHQVTVVATASGT